MSLTWSCGSRQRNTTSGGWKFKLNNLAVEGLTGPLRMVLCECINDRRWHNISPTSLTSGQYCANALPLRFKSNWLNALLKHVVTLWDYLFKEWATDLIVGPIFTRHFYIGSRSVRYRYDIDLMLVPGWLDIGPMSVRYWSEISTVLVRY